MDNRLDSVKVIVAIKDVSDLDSTMRMLVQQKAAHCVEHMTAEINIVNPSLYERTEFLGALSGIVDRLSRVGSKSPGK